jgi:transcriptional regulator with XRE-family HTH domain
MPATTRPRRIAPVDHNPEALAWAMRRAGWRQAELAREIGISRSLMSEALKGTRGLSPATLNKIAQTLGCPVTAIERPLTERVS